MSSTPIGLALEKQYLLSLIELEVKRRLGLIRRQIHKAQPKKSCPICQQVLKHPQRTFCSKTCVCVHMTRLAMSPEYEQQRAKQRQQRRVLTQCKICNKEMGWRVPGSVTYCSRECVGKDPAIQQSKAAKRRQLWQQTAYRQQRVAEAVARNADPDNGFGNKQRARE